MCYSGFDSAIAEPVSDGIKKKNKIKKPKKTSKKIPKTPKNQEKPNNKMPLRGLVEGLVLGRVD